VIRFIQFTLTLKLDVPRKRFRRASTPSHSLLTVESSGPTLYNQTHPARRNRDQHWRFTSNAMTLSAVEDLRGYASVAQIASKLSGVWSGQQLYSGGTSKPASGSGQCRQTRHRLCTGASTGKTAVRFGANHFEARQGHIRWSTSKHSQMTANDHWLQQDYPNVILSLYRKRLPHVM